MSGTSNAQSDSRGTGARRFPALRALGLLVLVATLALLTFNVWLAARLVEQQGRTSREHAFWILSHPGSSTADREQAFRQLVGDGNKEWRSADLRELNLAGFELPGAELQGANFERSNLAGAKLSGAKLNKSFLALADLSGAQLSEADLSEAQMYRTKLKQADLHLAKLRASFLQEADAQKADLRMADLSDADCLMVKLNGANLSGANFSGARLEGANLVGANLALTRFDGANIKNAEFSDSNWWHAQGFTAAQIEILKLSFAPGEKADSAVKEDFQKWLARGK